MIPATWEISAALTGAWRLLFLDKRGLQYFDASEDGFWKSFFAAALVLPAFLILKWIELSSLPVTAGPIRIVLVQSSAYVIGWVAFPLVAFYLCEVIGKGANYIRYIVAYNWFQVILVALTLPIILVIISGVLPAQGAQLIDWIRIFAILSYLWFLALIGMEAGGWVATLAVVIDLVVGELVRATGIWMLL